MLPEIMNMQRILYNDRSIPVPEPLHLLRLLNQCPTLVQLKIEFNETIVFTDIQHSATYPNIRHLELRYNPHTCGYPRAPFKPTFDVSLVLFKHFPCLHRLAVCYPRPQYLHMQAIFQYCPNLQQLILGYMPDHLLPEGTNILQGGLRLIALHGESPEGHLITQLLKDHASTIESLAVECVGWMVLPASNSPAGRVLFPRLRSLYLHWEMSGCPMQLARSVILRAPNLESAIVDRGGVKGEMLEALIDRPLRRIDLLCTPWSNGASELRFLDHHVHLGRSSTLEDIRCIITREYAEPEVRHMRRIHPNAPFTQLCDGWMLSITALQQLRSLELLVENTADELTAFLQHISQGCRSLENLTLEFQCFSFNIQWILPLAQHEKLNKMVIVSARFPDDMSTLLQHFSRLQAFDLKLKTIDRRGLLIDIPPSRFL